MALALSLEITAETRQAEAGLQRVERGVESLSDKAKAADQRLEAAFKELDQSIKTAEQSVSKMGRTQDGLTNAIVRFASGLAVGAAIKATISYADQINDLAAKAQVSTTAMQKLAGAAEDNGSSIAAVTNGMAELQRRLQSSDGGTIQALHRLNLNFEATKRLQPDQAFLAVAGAMERSNQKNRDANELFGRLGRELLPILNAEFVKAADNQLAMSEAAVKAGATTNDIWNKVWRDMKTIGMEALGGIADRLNVIYGLMQNSLPFAQELARVFSRGFMSSGLTGGLYSMVRTGINPSAFLSTLNSQALSTLPSAPGAPSLVPGGLAVPDADPQSAAVRAAIAELTGQTREAARSTRATAVAHARLAAEAERLAQAEANTAAALLNRPGYFQSFLNGGMSSGSGGGFLFTGTNLTNPWGGIANTSMLGGVGSNYSSLMRGGFNWSGVAQGGLNAALPWLAQLATGGSRGGQIGGTIGGGVGGILGSSSMFGGLSGLGGFAGVLGAAAPFLGPALGLLGGLIGRLFGPSRGAILGKEADARMDQTRAGLLQQFGSLDAIAATGRAGQELVAGWEHRNVAGERAFNQLVDAFFKQNELLTEQREIQAQIQSIEEQRKALADSLIPTWAQVSEIIARYQIAEGSLGQQINQLATTDTFRSVINDMETLFRAGADVGGVLYGMREEISKLVRDSVAFGTEIPANMRPFIEELARSGNLLDENGNAITDIANLRWGAAVESQADIVTKAIAALDESMQSLVDRLNEIIDKLANGLPDAAERGARGANGAISTIEGPEHRGGEAEGYARGGPVYAQRGLFIPRGTDTVPAMLTPGEFVMSAGATRRIGVGTLRAMNRGEAGGAGVNVTVNVAGYLDSQVARSHLASVVAAEIGRELRVRRRA